MTTHRLFHVSYGLRRIERFVPRVPKERLPDEDGTTPRICLAANVDDCLGAHPLAGELFDIDGSIAVHDVVHHRYEKDGHMSFGVPFVLYAFDVPSEHVRHPEDLATLVPDAVANQEYWAVCPLVPVATYFYLLYDANADGDLYYRSIPEDDFKRLIPVDDDFNDQVAPFDERPFSHVADE